MDGIGSRVTVSVKFEPSQIPLRGETIYVTNAEEELVFVSVPEIVLTNVDWLSPPEKPVPVGSNQRYKVPPGMIPLEGEIENPVPEQTVEVMAPICATGETNMVKVKLLPVQDPATGVTV